MASYKEKLIQRLLYNIESLQCYCSDEEIVKITIEILEKIEKKEGYYN